MFTKRTVFFHPLKTKPRYIFAPVIIILCLALASCDSSIVYENASLSGCYSQNNEIFHQFWFDGVSEFEDIFWTPESGTVSYAGTYTVSENELYLEYYSYDPEQYTLFIYNDGITLDDTPYYYSGQECY